MYLKSLELQGFKSFPDKVKLTFDKGLTGVVGPNGSGKSNIGDAVRWVLGEQSTKTLRGNKMEDVIFSGTTARKAVGFACVTLTIDNNQKELNNEDSEVAVTRKIYRSGESEYKINGKNVRLKDINELFMDTGLGRDGYSIIGQGRIAEIVDAKSTERRDIFEEAAGISKFRYKKAEAERKLIQSQDNINRLQDIVSELESRVEPLREQSQKAEKFIELAEQRKRLEISLWVGRLNELKGIIEKLSEDSLIYTAQYEGIENEIEKEEHQIQIAYQKMRDITVKTDEYKAFILDAERQSSEYKSEIAVCENDIEHSKSLIESIKQRQGSEQNSQKLLRDKISHLKNKLEDLKKYQKDINSQICENEQAFTDIEEQSQNIEKSFGEKETKINQLYVQQNDVKLKLAASEITISEAKQQLQSVMAQMAEFAERSEKYSADIKIAEETLKNIESDQEQADNRLSGLSLMYQKKIQKFDEKKALYEKTVFEIKEKQQRVNLLTDLENSMEGFNYSVKEIIKASKSSRISGIHGTVAQLITVDAMYATAVETALGGALQNIVVENENTAKRCIALLKEMKKGRATFLPVTSVRAYEFSEGGVKNETGFVALGNEIISCDSAYSHIMKNLLGKTVIAEDIDYASVIAKKYGYKFRIVTLDGQIVNAGGSFTGGAAVHSSGVLTRKNEINDLNLKISELDKVRDTIWQEVQKLKAQTDKLELDMEAVKSEKARLNEDKINLRSEIKSLDSILQQTDNQLQLNADSKSQIDTKISENTKQLELSEKMIMSVNKQIETAQSGITSQQNMRDELHARRKELSEKLYDIKLKNMSVKKDIEAVELEIKQINESVAGISENTKQLDDQLKQQQQIITVKNGKIQDNKILLEESAQKVARYRDDIKEASSLHNEYEQSITAMRAGLKSINDDKERISREISRLDEKKITMQRDYDVIVSQMWESYEFTRSEAEKIIIKIENAVEAQKQLNQIKASIKALGNINVSAIEEYKEVAKRYEFLSSQLSDIELSKKELEKLINNLTVDMQKIFAENFIKINENFKTIFTELFGGGKADLVLTDPENVLESGIEIVVAPPGKVIKNLISLSGGEQTFVAIAIYFAILKIKPAPFCILDEIDAALDEVNVRKYAMYLNNFIHTTQFILVTHRRGTMEHANVLYGVTMQQNGVSKLLKMNQVDIPDEIQ